MWKRIKGFRKYAVSIDGQVINIDRDTIRKTYKNQSGIVCVGLHDNQGIKRNKVVHHLVAEAFVEKTDDSFKQVEFIDGNKENLHVDNLRWVKQRARSPITKKGVISYHAGRKQVALSKRGGSKYFGVSTPSERPNTWIASTNHKGKTLFSKSFKSEIEAAKYYDFQIKKHNLLMRELNFPDE